MPEITPLKYFTKNEKVPDVMVSAVLYGEETDLMQTPWISDCNKSVKQTRLI